MAETFEVVVVGSGFGGAVVACRAAQRWPGGVMVIERGKRYGRGEFARTPQQMRENFWYADGQRRGTVSKHTDQRGLFDVRSYRRMDIVMAAGLGGGSLIYANVLLEPPDAVFRDQRWPSTCGRDAMQQYYDVVKSVLAARPIPDGPDASRNIPRTVMFETAAKAMGRASRRLDLAVFFGNDRDAPLDPGVIAKNAYGAEQTSCHYCGECDIGCNSHAKNTLDLNYLYVAQHRHGAVINTECLVENIEPIGSVGQGDPSADGSHGYRVQYRSLPTSEVCIVNARRVVVAAGSLGSTELLLRCRDLHRSLPRVSARLGEGFSGNGDFLAFIAGANHETRPNYGPVITQAIDFNLFDDHDPTRAFVMEDAGYPTELSWFIEGTKPLVFKVRSTLRTVRRLIARWLQRRAGGRIGDTMRDLLGGDVTGKSTVVLCMGIDSATGRLTLDRNGWIKVRWPLRRNRQLYRSIVRSVKQFGRAVEAHMAVPSPSWRLPMRRNVTVHALGGCGLAATPAQGVVDSDPAHFGQVFGYRHLYVADGAIVPTAVGANPSLTIAALAERVAEGITGNAPDISLEANR